MKQGETAEGFYDRLIILLDGVRYALKEKHPDGNNDEMMTPLKVMTLDSFLRGLPLSMAESIDAREPKALEEAYKMAERMESRMDANVISDTHHRDKTRDRNDYRRNDDDNYRTYNREYRGNRHYDDLSPSRRYGWRDGDSQDRRYVGQIKNKRLEEESFEMRDIYPLPSNYRNDRRDDRSRSNSYNDRDS